MFGIGSTELLVILLVALIVLGPKSLASFSRTLGKYMGEFKRASTEFQRSLNIEAAREETRAAEKKARFASSATTKEVKTASNTADSDGAEKTACLSGIPTDSPVAQAIARASAEASDAAARAGAVPDKAQDAPAGVKHDSGA